MNGDMNAVLVAYLHRELSDAQMAQLEARLRSDLALARRLIEIASEEATLIRWARGVHKAQQIDDAESALRAVEDLQADARQAREPAQNPPAKIFPALRFPTWGDITGMGTVWLGSGVVLSVLAIAIGAWLLWRPGTLPGGPAIARVTRLEEATWAVGHPAVREGTGIPAHWELNLKSGAVEIAYPSGVTLRLTGPSRLKMSDSMHGLLELGQVAAYVPSPAIGYTIDTPSLAVRDQGTRFGVRVDPKAVTEVHVFEGAVEAKSSAGEGRLTRTQPLTMTQAARFDTIGKLIDWLPPDYDSFAAKRLAPGVVSTSENVRWLLRPPPSLERDGYSSDDTMILVLERQDVILPLDLRVTFKAPMNGTKSAYDSNTAVLPAGLRVDSYLLHFNAAKINPNVTGIGGNVKFERPIVGVIARGDQLINSDSAFGAPGVQYEIGDAKIRGLKKASGGGGSDVLIFSGRNGVGIHCDSHRGSVSELRILVEAKL